MAEIIKNKPHALILNDRKSLSVSGITEVGNFDDESIVLYSDFGGITVKGEELQVSLLNTETGEVSVQGRINSIQYSDRMTKHISFWARILK